MLKNVVEKKSWALPESFKYCERIAKNHYENFPVGSFLLPKKLRPYIWVLYAFARTADDIADENYLEAERLPHLDHWQKMLIDCYEKRVNHPVFLPLSDLVRQFKIPKELLIDLITAFKMDVVKKRYSSFEEVLFYCQHSANPVGRLVLYLFNITDPKAHKLSDYICTALQLANFWQDINVDLEKDRIYIPLEDFEKFNYSVSELMERKLNLNFQRLLAIQVQRTKHLFRKGADLPSYVGGRLGFELRCVILGGMQILKSIEDIRYDTLHQQPCITGKQKFSIFGKALFNFKRSLAPRKPIQVKRNKVEV